MKKATLVILTLLTTSIAWASTEQTKTPEEAILHARKRITEEMLSRYELLEDMTAHRGLPNDVSNLEKLCFGFSSFFPWCRESAATLLSICAEDILQIVNECLAESPELTDSLLTIDNLAISITPRNMDSQIALSPFIGHIHLSDGHTTYWLMDHPDEMECDRRTEPYEETKRIAEIWGKDSLLFLPLVNPLVAAIDEPEPRHKSVYGVKVRWAGEELGFIPRPEPSTWEGPDSRTLKKSKSTA